MNDEVKVAESIAEEIVSITPEELEKELQKSNDNVDFELLI